MTLRLAAIAALTLALAACSQPDSSSESSAPASNPATAPAEASQPDAAPLKDKLRATPEDIARIEASGKTGFWSDVTEACSKGKPPATTLSWNVKASGASKVVVFVVDQKNGERHFGRGGPVGLRTTGPWLRPGLIFLLRDADKKTDLGSITIGKKDC